MWCSQNRSGICFRIYVIILLVMHAGSTVAQSDSLFLSEQVPADFITLPRVELVLKYGFNDTAGWLINAFEQRHTESKWFLFGSVAVLPISIALVAYAVTVDVEEALVAGPLGIGLLWAAVPGIIYTSIQAGRTSRSHAYNELRHYNVDHTLSKRALRLLRKPEIN
jgi:hypothetical protein